MFNRSKGEVDSTLPVAIVTGATSGFGLLTCIDFATAGYRVVAIIRNIGKIGRLESAIASMKLEHLIEYIEVDVTNFKKVEETINQVINSYKRIDVLVNSAGFMVRGLVEETSIELWQHQFQTNFFGLVAITKEVVKHMRNQRCGRIINISSLFGRISLPSYAPYIASKYAVEGFSEALRLEMLPFNVYVSLIEPGPYKTDMWISGIENVDMKNNMPYSLIKKNIKSLSNSMFNQGGAPEEVSRLVVKIARTHAPKLRYQPGLKNKIIWNSFLLIPRSLFERVVIKNILQ